MASTNTSAVNSVASSRSGTPQPNTALGERSDGEDAGKLKTFLSILKKFMGVSDMAAVRFSLPAQLMAPIPNLEYWHYIDRPDAFAAIGDSDDPVGRMLGCLRFWFTKDLKYVHGKPCKPYNSTLGEFFRCAWEVKDEHPALVGQETKGTTAGKPVQVFYFTEQTSHHPPVSAFYVDCPEKGVSARGFDQISAKFTGTSVKVVPGSFNEGIFINLERWGNEEYQLTHPAAFLGGFLRGNLNITVADTCFVTCRKTGMKVILHYLEEGWLGKTQNKVQGVIYRCDVDNDTKTKIKDVSDKDVIGRVEGAWVDKVYFTLGSTEFSKVPEKDRQLLVDVHALMPIQKVVPPQTEQLPNESQRFWADLTNSILAKEYTKATNVKTEIEEKQRAKAAERKAQNVEWQPIFFTGATTPAGRPELSPQGKAAIERLHKGDWHLETPKEFGAF